MPLPVYDSLKQASGATGIPVQAFKTAKAAGCAAFKSNRIDLAQFLRWWFNRDPEHVDDRARKLCAEADLAEVEVAKARGELVLITDVERWAGGVVTALRQGILGSSLLDAEKDELIAHLRKLLERSATPAGGDDAEVGEADGAASEADR